jgi:MFS family permease
MVYPLYARQWHLTSTVTTSIFAIYPITVVGVLLLFGNLSDYIGRRAVMLLGVLASLIGVLCFATAGSVSALLVGRWSMGLGVGLSASPSAAAMVEFSDPLRRDRTGGAITIAQSLGLAAAFVLGGACIKYLLDPLHSTFWILSGVLVAVLLAVHFLPIHTSAEASGPWRIQIPRVTGELRKTFVVSALSMSTAYALGAITLSLGAQIASDLIRSRDFLINGLSLSLFAIVSGGFAIIGKDVRPRSAITVGGIGSVLSMGLLLISSLLHSLPAFIAATAAAGFGYSFLVLGGFNELNAKAAGHHRAAAISTALVLAYLAQSFSAILLGVVATKTSLGTAICLGFIGICTLTAFAITFNIMREP